MPQLEQQFFTANSPKKCGKWPKFLFLAITFKLMHIFQFCEQRFPHFHIETNSDHISGHIREHLGEGVTKKVKKKVSQKITGYLT